MKITGVSVDVFDDYQDVTVVVRLPLGAELDEADIQRIFDTAREIAGQEASRDTRNGEAPGGPKMTIDQAVQSGRRQRGASPTPSQASPAVETAEPTTAEAPVRRRRGAEPAAPVQDSAATAPAPAAGRSRRATTPVAATTPSNASSEPASASPASPSSGGRVRRPANPTSAPSAAPSAESQPSPSTGRTRTSSASSATAAPTKITDQDLVKACALAAQAHTPDFVVSCLLQFGAPEANKLKPDQRVEFVAMLDAGPEA
jgi:hypothetical protein